MGAKQSGPAAANGRTRAYSGSDLPSSSGGGATGTAGSGGGGGGGGGARAEAAERFPAQVPGAHQTSASGAAAAASAAPRSRSLGGAVGTVASGTRAAQSSFSIPNSSSGPYGSQDSVHSSPEDGGGRDRPAGGGPGGPRLVIGSLPAHLSPHILSAGICDAARSPVLGGKSHLTLERRYCQTPCLPLSVQCLLLQWVTGPPGSCTQLRKVVKWSLALSDLSDEAQWREL
ncbi:hypothetical protein MC885_007021 [Smutsia gigantea]|nr:hypothetical protein MC885_007021 [Smutsia gigantea]